VLLSPLWGGGNGLIGFGIALAVIALVVAVPSPAALSAGDRTIVVTDPADLEDRYGLGAGTLTLDLRDLELPPGTTEVQAGVNLGELVVVVPPEVSVAGEGRVFLGEVDHFDRTNGGIAPRASLADPGTDADRVLELRLRVGLGQIEVRR
jgi:predicted membrane protein